MMFTKSLPDLGMLKDTDFYGHNAGAPNHNHRGRPNLEFYQEEPYYAPLQSVVYHGAPSFNATPFIGASTPIEKTQYPTSRPIVCQPRYDRSVPFRSNEVFGQNQETISEKVEIPIAQTSEDVPTSSRRSARKRVPTVKKLDYSPSGASSTKKKKIASTPPFNLRESSKPLKDTRDSSKSLRFFARRVCTKVEAKKQTNYTEVANEIVAEYFGIPEEEAQEDYTDEAKNIRRRIYDALNVLVALKVIHRYHKTISWSGIKLSFDDSDSVIANTAIKGNVNPSAKRFIEFAKNRNFRKDDLADDEVTREDLEEEEKLVAANEQSLREMITKLVAYKSLIQENRSKVKDIFSMREPKSYFPMALLICDKNSQINFEQDGWTREITATVNFGEVEVLSEVDLLIATGHSYNLQAGLVRPNDIKSVRRLAPLAVRGFLPPGDTPDSDEEGIVRLTEPNDL